MTAKLLWTANPVRLRRPNLLWTAAPLMSDVARWRVENPWADSTELVAFQADREGDFGPIGAPFASVHDCVPWRVVNPPRHFPPRAAWEKAYAQHPDVFADPVLSPFMRAFIRYRAAALEAATLLMHRQPSWILFADADQGALAIAVAAMHRRAVALCATPPGPMAQSMAVEMGVSILVANESDMAHQTAFKDEERIKHGEPDRIFAVTDHAKPKDDGEGYALDFDPARDVVPPPKREDN